MRKLSFIAACREYFGIREGQTSIEFLKEVKALDEKDRAYFTELFKTVGIEIV